MSAASIPATSPWLQCGFARFLRHYLGRHFNAVRIAADSVPVLPRSGPVIVCANHPSWWDPLILLYVAQRFLPHWRCFGPIDAAALERYSVLGRLGLFGVERNSPGSLRDFLATTDAILHEPDSAIGLTAQGEFADTRDRPVTLLTGAGHLLKRHPDACFVTLAVEYTFWNERAPEALLRFGDVWTADPGRASRSSRELTALAAQSLERNMDHLAELARTRDPQRFNALIEGRKGVGGVYDLGRRLRSWARGRTFDPSHAAVGREKAS